MFKYRCNQPRIDDATQEPENCKNMVAWVECLPAPNISCRLANGTEFRFSGDEVGFNRSISCRNVSGYSYKVAVALSLFLGWLGADRFYLGYPALGLLKFCTVGFCGIGSLVDFVLISMQIVGPSDKLLPKWVHEQNNNNLLLNPVNDAALFLHSIIPNHNRGTLLGSLHPVRRQGRSSGRSALCTRLPGLRASAQ
ncbi:hypothetical protein DPEC_G00270060 [Dallia pectoralis]|uniref:Uncharacterized protein n=1 Tax=Dallia pectoralis TaxID=75939 RepID=A0ACC2FPG8_DALPE|nr:hypothetical protein DPEC_G00270060 [Dallia pectoralis]